MHSADRMRPIRHPQAQESPPTMLESSIRPIDDCAADESGVVPAVSDCAIRRGSTGAVGGATRNYPHQPPSPREMMVPRVRLFDLPIDVVNMQQAVVKIMAWRGDSHSGCRFVVTPNVDHTVLANHFPAFQRAYEDAHLVLADGLPIIVASRLLKKPLPERVAGSELVPRLFAAASHERPLRVFLLGAAPGVADRAATRIGQQWPAVTVVGTYSPPFGFAEDPQEEQRILDRLHQADPELIVVGLAAPQQEIWVHRLHQQLPARIALCAARRLTSSQVKRDRPQFGCVVADWSGSSVSSRNRADWQDATPVMPGSFRSSSGANRAPAERVPHSAWFACVSSSFLHLSGVRSRQIRRNYPRLEAFVNCGSSVRLTCWVFRPGVVNIFLMASGKWGRCRATHILLGFNVGVFRVVLLLHGMLTI